MLNTSTTLSKWLKYYNVYNLQHGALEDKIGDAFESYCEELFNSINLLNFIKDNSNNPYYEASDIEIFSSLFKKTNITISDIKEISATTYIPSRKTGGNPKTDMIVTISTVSKKYDVPISIKHTSAKKVAMAEFDVATIINEVGINDNDVISLMQKHQSDASAKNFTPYEKEVLFERLKPFSQKLVTWVVSGTSNPSRDLQYPLFLMKFDIQKFDSLHDLVINNFNCFSIDEYVNLIMYGRNNKLKKGGFGTGLSWTYATGSKGKKIQFKG